MGTEKFSVYILFVKKVLSLQIKPLVPLYKMQ